MLYLAIDQHKHQLTINIRNEHGEVIQKCQISTNPADIDEFFTSFTKKARQHRGFMAIVEVCGFNPWLLATLEEHQCNETIVIQPHSTALNKTDKRDADALGALLWNNRKLLKDGQRPNGICRVIPASPDDADVRQLDNLRRHLVRQRTMVINKIKGIINKHNLSHSAPTENYATEKFRQWIKTVELPVMDRLEVDNHIETLKLQDKQISEKESELVKRAETSKEKMEDVCRLKAIPGISVMGAFTLLARIGDVKRFKSPDSLANYFGLTPGCDNTAGKHRVGGITKRGSAAARNVLNAAVSHIVRKDLAMKEWHKGIKKRGGTKTARVAVMRRLATIIWHMLRWGKPYQFRYDPPAHTPKAATAPKKDDLRSSGEVLEASDNRNYSRKKEGTPSRCRGKAKA